jgi:ketosteroid isomerase-like protein
VEGTDIVALARRAYTAFADRDLEGLAAISSPSIEMFTITGVVAQHPGPYKGRDGIEEYIREVDEVWDEIELTANEFIELSGDRVMVVGRVRARRDTALIDSPNAWMWEFEEGLVRRVRVFSDPEQARELVAGDADSPSAA